MAKKKVTEKAAQETEALNEHDLNPRQELFCQYYVSNGDTFANATTAYAEAYEYKLEELSKWTAEDEHDSEYDLACNTCAANGNRLLRNAKVRARVTVLLNALLKDEIVDGELAKLIQQDNDFPTKVRSIAEYNKLRGRIIDKTQNVDRLPFGESDLSSVIATLPQERQDYFYGVIKSLIEEAELSRSTGTPQSGVTG
ncbi:MAG: hypothetical protein AAB403_13055 [Planctomycetota bacterium]